MGELPEIDLTSLCNEIVKKAEKDEEARSRKFKQKLVIFGVLSGVAILSFAAYTTIFGWPQGVIDYLNSQCEISKG